MNMFNTCADRFGAAAPNFRNRQLLATPQSPAPLARPIERRGDTRNGHPVEDANKTRTFWSLSDRSGHRPCVAAIVFFTLVGFLVVYLFDRYEIELDYHRSPEIWGRFAVLLSAPIALVAYLIGISWRTYRTSFFLLAGVAAITFCVSFGLLTVFWYVVGFGHRWRHFTPPPDVPGSVLSQLISTATLGVSTVTAFSTMWLAWRLDRRQGREAELRARESELRVAQLQIEVNKSRQPRTEDD
jgi:uncharacterized membrane protein